MKTEKEFRDFFQQELLPHIQSFEGRRKENLSKRLKVYGVGAMFLFAHFILVRTEALPKFTLLLSLLSVPVLCYYIYERYFYDYQLDVDFKSEILGRILYFFDDSLQYEPENYLPYQDFQNSGFFSLKPDIYMGDDLISGAIDGIPIRFSEIRVAYRVFHDSKDFIKPRYRDIFWGILLVAEYPREFKGEIVIRTNFLQKNLGYVGRLIQEYAPQQGKYLYTRQTDFSQYFSAYTPDESTGEALLTLQLQERLLRIQRRYKNLIHLAMKHQIIWLAIHLNREFFSINKTRNWLDYQYIKTFYDDLSLILGIIDDLNIDELDLSSSNEESPFDKFGREKLLTKKKIQSWLDKLFDYVVENIPRLQKEKSKYTQ